MTRIAISFSRPAGGFFSHFAHFISDFVLPIYSFARKSNLLDLIKGDHAIDIELADRLSTRFGPLSHLVPQFFPGLRIIHVQRFTMPAFHIRRRAWHNDPDDVEHFIGYLKEVLSIKPGNSGVIIVQRGLDRQKYSGGNFFVSSGADRRTIGAGFEKIVRRVGERRADSATVVLEHLPLAEQISLFLRADTLIGQHGAAFAHAHWMPRGGHLIELQCGNHRLCPHFVPSIAKIRHHKHSVVYYPGRYINGALTMSILDATRVSRLVGSPVCGVTTVNA